jgi:hypothetical protein
MSSLAIGPVVGGSDEAGSNVGLGEIVGVDVGMPTILHAVNV